MTYVKFEGVCKSFDDGTKAVDDFKLEIKEKEFIVLVGPSGCGKSTTLRMLAGLEELTSGNIKIEDNIVNDLPSSVRDIGMVFQSYALYPHLNVEQNLSFGLRLQSGERRLDDEEIDQRVNDLANILGIDDILSKMPKSLSGGQRQRVALGRALAKRPKVILMDEPLSNLDAKLRSQMRIEIRRLHEELGMTTIYVTHDQVEAMTLGDRLVVMKDGQIQQVDRPLDTYKKPKNTFVASFIGTPAMNLVPGKIENNVFSNHDINLNLKTKFNGNCKIGIRPENVQISTKKATELEIVAVEKLGAESIYHLKSGKTTILVLLHGDIKTEGKNKTLSIKFNDSDILIFDNKNNLVDENKL